MTRAGRTELNLLGQVDFEAGESRRNEKFAVTLIDNAVLRERNIRIGTDASIVQEFRVDLGYFGAEYGGRTAASSHLSASRSAGIHGSAYVSHNNSVFSARTFFEAGGVKPAQENDYGFALDLPLWQFSNFSAYGSRQTARGHVNRTVLVPTADERTPLTNDLATRAVVERILAAYPDELPNRTDINPRVLNANTPQKIDTDPIGARLDHLWRDRDRFSFDYRFLSQRVDAFNLVGGENPDTATKNHQARITWSRAWSPRTTSDLSIGFDRTGSLLTPDDSSVGPSIFAGFALQSIGPGPDMPINRTVNRFRYAGRFQQVRGPHSWTAGLELLRRQVNGFESGNHRGSFRFGSDFGRDAITNLRLGTPSSYSVSIGNVHRGFRNWESQFYVGERWNLAPKLTVNMGLRYRPITAPIEVNGLNEIPYSCDCNNLAPSFGLAYDANAWGVLRASYGLFFGQIFPATYGQSRFNPPGNLAISVANPDLADPLKGLGGSNLDPNTRRSVSLLDENLRTPYSHQYNVSWELGLPKDWNLDVGYVGSRSHKLLMMWHRNRAQPVEGIPQTTQTINERRPDQRFFVVRNVLNRSRGYYDAAKVMLRTPRWAGLNAAASYWWSKASDLGSDYTNTASERDGRLSRSPSEFETPAQRKGLSSFDHPHALLWRVNYETPRLARGTRWPQKVFGQWQLSAVMLLKSGTPFTVISGSDAPGFGNVDGEGGDRPNLEDRSVLGRTIDDPATSKQLLPRSAFSFIRPTDTRGDLGRQTFRRDGVRNVNTAVSRRWPIGSAKAMLLRVESINSFNSPQFAEPGRALADPNFGEITSTLNDGRTFRFLLRFSF